MHVTSTARTLIADARHRALKGVQRHSERRRDVSHIGALPTVIRLPSRAPSGSSSWRRLTTPPDSVTLSYADRCASAWRSSPNSALDCETPRWSRQPRATSGLPLQAPPRPPVKQNHSYRFALALPWLVVNRSRQTHMTTTPARYQATRRLAFSSALPGAYVRSRRPRSEDRAALARRSACSSIVIPMKAFKKSGRSTGDSDSTYSMIGSRLAFEPSMTA